jgi:hypothetical protein
MQYWISLNNGPMQMRQLFGLICFAFRRTLILSRLPRQYGGSRFPSAFSKLVECFGLSTLGGIPSPCADYGELSFLKQTVDVVRIQAHAFTTGALWKP